MTDTNREIAVRPIAHIDFSGNTADMRVAMALTDPDGEVRAYAIDPPTLRALLPSLISLVATWQAKEPDFSVEALGGTQNALIAKHAVIARGRDDQECAVRMFLGKDLDLTFLLPLGAFVAAANAFAQHSPMIKKSPAN